MYRSNATQVTKKKVDLYDLIIVHESKMAATESEPVTEV